MMYDHTHFKTEDELVFTTRGFYHPSERVRAIPLYKRISGSRVLEKKVDEFGTLWLNQVHPEWIMDSPFGQGIFVPASSITDSFDPFDSEETIKHLEDETAVKLISLLDVMGIPPRDIGFLGSYLVDTGRKPHDVDLLIRGLRNLKTIQLGFADLLKELGAGNTPSLEYVKKSIPRYEQKYNAEFNDFTRMIERRWPTIYLPGKFFGKLRFTPNQDEVPTYNPPKGRRLINMAIEGVVLDSSGTNFMPRQFTLESDGGEINATTYFWDFSYCVKNRDKVDVRGDFFPESKILVLSNPKQHGIKFI